MQIPVISIIAFVTGLANTAVVYSLYLSWTKCYILVRDYITLLEIIYILVLHINIIY